MINIPIIFTLIRLIFYPTLFPFLLMYGALQNSFHINLLLSFLFAFGSFTDFLDGFFARRYNQVTTLGKLLDPIADKFLTFSTLVTLLALDRIYFYWVIILIGRDLFITGLRLIALEYGLTLQVTSTAKIKTVLYNVYLMLAILNVSSFLSFNLALMFQTIEMFLLFSTIMLSLGSAYQYYHVFISALFLADRQ